MATTKTKSRWIIGGLCILAIAPIALSAAAVPPSPAPDLNGRHAAVLSETTQNSSFFANLAKIYMPRSVCMFHEEPVIWLHVTSDLLIMLSYYSIPFALIYFVRRRRDVAFGAVFWMFAAFILACGTTHFFGTLDIWRPYYRLEGIVKAITAGISIITAIALWRLMPQLLTIPSAAGLETMVMRRTAELTQANADRQRLLEAERTAREEAERANKVKDEFLATLSHELRTPLNAILGWSQILRRRQIPDADVEEGLTVIERNARAQTRLIAELLDMSRIVSGKLKLDVQAMDLPAVIDAAVAVVRPSADAKGIRLERIGDTSCEPIRADAARLQQVLWNILTNSIKFTPAGGKITIALNRIPGHAQVVMSDDGQGIGADFLPHIFERFRQADGSTTRRHGGLGLGLAIAKSIVEAHGGTLTAQSPGEGQGSTFTINVPFGIAPAGLLSQNSSQSTADGADIRRLAVAQEQILEGVKVLLVDDGPDSVEFIARWLRECKAVVTTATSAPQAFELFQRERPDVLISDIGMPGEDGYQLVRRIRSLPAEQGGNTPAIALTAFAGADARDRSVSAGYHLHFAKPIEPHELTTAIAQLAAGTQNGKP